MRHQPRATKAPGKVHKPSINLMVGTTNQKQLQHTDIGEVTPRDKQVGPLNSNKKTGAEAPVWMLI